jgi:hypothetical protein
MKPLFALLSLALLVSAAAPAAAAQPAEEIRFVNRVPAPYRLTHLRLVVDGVVRYDGPLAANLWVPQGRHSVEAIAEYTLDDPVLSYVRNYHLKLVSTHLTPAVPVAGTLHVTVAAVPRGGVTVPIDRRAALAWEERR